MQLTKSEEISSGSDLTQKKFHLLNWNEVCQNYREGGANVKNMKAMNLALLGKWTWWLATEKDALWARIIRGKYGSSMGDWWPTTSSYYKASHIWKGILSSKDPVIQNNSFVLGNGASIWFWEDPWTGNMPSRFQFPLIYHLSPKKEILISECYSASSTPIVWDIRTRRNLSDIETEEFQALMACIFRSAPINNQPDGIVWQLEKSGLFSIKSLYGATRGSQQHLH